MYSQYLRHVPGAQRTLRVGEPIMTQWGQGLITDIRGVNGGYTHEDYQTTKGQGVIIVSVLFPGQKAPVDIPLSNLVNTSYTGSAPPGPPL